jgi:predicted dithiol-disulfide oxidoreductase (DUF899 family)
MTKYTTSTEHNVVSHKDWIAARQALLAKEKEFSRTREQLSEQRRNLPWEKVDKEYAFDGPKGRETLADLFAGKSQLIVYHFMFDPSDDEGCAHCSFWADHYDGMAAHLNHRDVSFVVISRAPLAKIEPFKKRMGWRFKWVSSFPNDFNYDYHVSFTPEQIKSGSMLYNYAQVDMDMMDREGISVFYKDQNGALFHTYSCFARGIDMVNTTYQFLDLVPKGRDEHPDRPQEWVRFHDRYEG